MDKKMVYIFSFIFFMVFFIFPSPVFSSDSRKPFIYPIQGTIITDFRQEYFDGDKSCYFKHTGIDIKGEPNDKVRSAANGLVSYTGFSPIGGLTVVIRHNKYLRSTYLNLASIYASRGDHIRQGDVIASLGAEDDPSSKECHLHFAVIYGNKYIDPGQLLDIDYSNISRFLRLSYIDMDFRVY